MWNCIHSHYFCRLAWFTLSGRVNRHSTKYWFSENGRVVHEVPLYDLKCWSLVCSECSQNQMSMLLEETNSSCSFWWVLTSFCRELREGEKCTVTVCRTVLWLTQLTSWCLTHCGFLKLQMWIHAIIMFEGQRNVECTLPYHRLCKICNIIFKGKLVIFKN